MVASYTDLEIIQQQLRAVGIDYPIRKLDVAGQSKALADNDYDIYAWTMTPADPTVVVRDGRPAGAVGREDLTARSVAGTPGRPTTVGAASG